MAKLFLVYLGGRIAKANIELHDIRFVAGNSIEDCYPALRQSWFGNPKGLHLDSFMEVKFVDGFRIEIGDRPGESGPRLFFINFGGYDPNSLAEQHEFGLFVAETADHAKRNAKNRLLTTSVHQHRDDMFDIDDCFVVNQVGEYFVHLIPDNQTQAFKPDWYGYKVIDREGVNYLRTPELHAL